MKAKRVMALIMAVMLGISGLGADYMPVYAAGETGTVAVSEDAVSANESEEAESAEEKPEITGEEPEENEKTAEETADEAEEEEGSSAETVLNEDESWEEPETEEAETGEEAGADEIGSQGETRIVEEMVIAGVDISSYLTIDSNGVITKYSYTGTDITDIIIPSTVNGITVKAIGDGVFKNHEELISVQFPSTLETIGNTAFQGASLGSNQRDGKLVIPASVKTIGCSAFSGCKALYEVTFEAGSGSIAFRTSLGDANTFSSCAALTKINLSNRISTVPTKFAKDCANLTTVNWSSTVKSIDNAAFANDVLLDSTDLTNTVLETIGNEAFSNCTGFGLVKFPGTLKTIGASAFYKTLMGKRSTPGHLVIPASVGYIGYEAFKECVYLDSVTFEDAAGEALAIAFQTNLGKGNTFTNCKALRTITLSNRTVSLPVTFASSCTALTTVNWSKELKAIGESAFAGDVELSSSDFSATSLEVVRDNAFSGCSALGIVKFPESLVTIGNCAFQKTPMGNAKSAGDLVIPAGVKTIGYDAFNECEYLGSVTFQEYTGSTALSTIEFYQGDTFMNCKSLKTITLSNRVGVIPRTFAKNCKALTTVKWVSSVSGIGNEAFAGDEALNSPDFTGTSLKTIGDSAFSGCTAFGLAKFPRSLKTIGHYAFQNTAMGSKTSGGILVIPEEVSSIGIYAFSGCAYLKSVKIEDYSGDGALPVLDIISNYGRAYTFANCPMLEEIIFSDRVAKIPGRFANECATLTHITIPDGVKTIEEYAFYVKTENNKKITTDVTGDSDVVKNYDWDKDNRVRGKVTNVAVESVTLDKTVVEIAAGKSITLHATVNPSNATNKSVYWGSSNTAVATVEDGKITGKAPGKAVITVTTVDGGKKANAAVTVTESSSGGGDEDEQGEEQEITLPGKKNVPVTAYVRFVTNGADEGQSFYTQIKNGKKLNLNSKFTKKGYTFKGWYCSYVDKKGNVKNKKLRTLTGAILSQYSAKGVLTLEARFQVNTYIVKFSKVGEFNGKKVKASGRIQNQKIVYSVNGEDVESAAMMGGLTPKDTTLELKGWTIYKKGTKVMYKTGEKVSLEKLVPVKGKTITLYPVFGKR